MNTQTLERGTITVQHIFPAKASGKSAWIKDVDGMMFGFWPDKIDVVKGESYEIEFSANVKNGTTYRDLKAARMIARTDPPARPAASAPSQRVEPPRHATAPNGNRAGQYDKHNYRQSTPPRESEQMFVCSILNAFIQTGRIDCARDHLAAAINELRAAYASTFGRDDAAE